MKSYSQKFNLIFKKILAISLIVSFFVPNISLAEDVFIDAQIEESPVVESVTPDPILENEEEIEELVASTTPVIEEEVETSPEELKEVLVEKIEQNLISEIPKDVPEILEEEVSNEEIIVKFKSDSVDVDKFAESEDLIVTETIEDENISVVVSTEGESIADTIENILENKNVEYAEPNYERTFNSLPLNDTEFLSQWALKNTGQEVFGFFGTNDADINAPEAWEISEGEKQEIIVAVIDTGVDYTHPDLQNQMWDGSNCKDENGILIVGGCTHGYDFIDNDTIPLPVKGVPSIEGISYDFHGTHVAGIIASEKNNSFGIAGVAPNVKIMALRFNSSVLTEIQAIDFARENGAHIINASYSGNRFSQAEYDAIKRFTDAGGIFIAAAANEARNNDDINESYHQYPSDHDIQHIISVASTDQKDELSYFSNYGNKSVDVGAPGSNILSTGLSGDYLFLDGTSMSAPHAVGIASLVWGYNPELTPSQVKAILLESGKSLPALLNKTVTGKRVDALGALSVFRPEILNLNFSTTTEGLVAVTFNIRDGFAGLNARLRNFSYSADDGLTWTAPVSADTSTSLSDTFRQVVKTTTATSSDLSFSWNINHADVLLKESLLAQGSKNKFKFEIFDGATTSQALSSVFSINNVATSTPTPEPEPEPTPEPTPPPSGGGGGGGGSSGSTKGKKGDINSDNTVDILDFNSLMIGWGRKGETPADINNDGTVDILDFNILMVNWK